MKKTWIQKINEEDYDWKINEEDKKTYKALKTHKSSTTDSKHSVKSITQWGHKSTIS